MTLTYDLKVDLAIIIALLSIFGNIYKTLYDHFHKKKIKQIDALEKVFGIASELLYYPFKSRKEYIKKNQYKNINKDIEKAVKFYTTSRWEELYYGTTRIFPSYIKTDKEREEFHNTVINEAKALKDSEFKYIYSLNAYEKSPICYFNKKEYKKKFDELFSFVINHSTSFPKIIIKYATDILYCDHHEIKSNYESALRVCKNYFQHNKMDFEDPYYDLLLNIREMYLILNQSYYERIHDYLYRLKNKLKYKFNIL